MWSYTLITLVLEVITVTAQQATPTNASLPAGLANPSELLFSLSEGSGGYGPPYGIDYALDANRGKWNDFHTIMQTNQTIFRTTPFNIPALTNNSIAYISCDPEDYNQSNISLQQTIQQATFKIAPSSYLYGAIILYSRTSNWCNYTTDITYAYPNIFILPNATQAQAIYNALSQTKPGDQIASIFNNDTSMNGTATGASGDGNNDNGSNSGMMTPSTTVAMIILYSVTGIITLCFVVVIITGALRARRHPERYGLLNLPGNAHQRRARGLARAILDTIPIVKFGEKEPSKLSPDLETGTEMHGVKAQGLDGAHSPVADSQPPAKDAASSETTVPQDASQAPAELEDDSTDNGLACSVCTEDFIHGQDLRLLPCNHKFHPECIDPWLLNVSGTCPLCRIDLRPPEQREDSVADASNETDTTPQTTNTAGTDTPPNRTNRFSMFLNRRRMGEATPAQRLRILRELRNLRRNNTVPPVPGVPQAENASGSATPTEGTAMRSNRVTRFFGRREGSPAASSPERSNPQQ